MTTDKEGKYIMVVTERGYGKMSPLEEYRLSNRGGKGLKLLMQQSEMVKSLHCVLLMAMKIY